MQQALGDCSTALDPRYLVPWSLSAWPGPSAWRWMAALDGRPGAHDDVYEMTVLPMVGRDVSSGCSTTWSTASASAAARRR